MVECDAVSHGLADCHTNVFLAAQFSQATLLSVGAPSLLGQKSITQIRIPYEETDEDHENDNELFKSCVPFLRR